LVGYAHSYLLNKKPDPTCEHPKMCSNSWAQPEELKSYVNTVGNHTSFPNSQLSQNATKKLF